MPTTAPIIIWFRQDLRLADNPALSAAVKTGAPIIPVYILDDENAGDWKMGGASRWWLHHSLLSLNESLSGNLACFSGDAHRILTALVKSTGAQGLYWNRCYEPWCIKRDTHIKEDLETQDIEVQSYNGSLLFEPWVVKKDDGTPYRVFTPYFRRGCMGTTPPATPLPAPRKITYADRPAKALSVEALKLLPKKPEPRWDKKMEQYWAIGEKGAQKQLKHFLENGLKGYKEGRNFPAQEYVSRLSPRLHFGEISPRTVWYATQERMVASHAEVDGDHFMSELAWREFSHSLLFYNHDLPTKPLQSRFESFPWARNERYLRAWQSGMTGYPIVDAGMRELWETGYMHNRVRMIVGSFLVKHLLLHWKHGEEWFWDCLVDADLANNAASWQWIAGCGADAAPYFRIFNPIGQGEKFDAKGEYVRRWCPELSKLPDDVLHKPWEAPPLILKQAGVTLGETYPKPIVDHKAAREKALSAFQMTRTG